MEMSGQLHTLAASHLRKKPPSTHQIGGWVDCRAGLDDVVKRNIPCPYWESNTGCPAHCLVTIFS
jgi:hypothetical protein